MSEWKLLRDKDDLLDDPAVEDIVSQDEINFTSGIVNLVSGPIRTISEKVGKVLVTFRDDDGFYIYGNPRGRFDIQYLEFVSTFDGALQADSPPSLNFPFVVDSVLLKGGLAFRAMHPPPGSDDVESATVRLENIVAPPGATRIRIFFKGG